MLWMLNYLDFCISAILEKWHLLCGLGDVCADTISTYFGASLGFLEVQCGLLS